MAPSSSTVTWPPEPTRRSLAKPGGRAVASNGGGSSQAVRCWAETVPPVRPLPPLLLLLSLLPLHAVPATVTSAATTSNQDERVTGYIVAPSIQASTDQPPQSAQLESKSDMRSATRANSS
jgi:hypothetical protein